LRIIYNKLYGRAVGGFRWRGIYEKAKSSQLANNKYK
jgi:hypothetical protein